MIWNYVLLNEMFQFYDLASVFFYVLGMFLILKDKFWLLLVTLALGVLNKETAVYLILAFVLYNYKNIFTKTIILKTFLLSMVFLIIKGILMYIFRNNPGAVVESTSWYNFQLVNLFFESHLYAKDLLLCFGGMYFFVIALFVSGKWRKLNTVNARGKIYMHLGFIPYLIMGVNIVYFLEARVYGELIPMITTLFVIYLSTFEKLNFRPVDD
jgi:hypothetical protein